MDGGRHLPCVIITYSQRTDNMGIILRHKEATGLPASSDLATYELVSSHDGQSLYIKNAEGEVVMLPGPGSSSAPGVQGPAGPQGAQGLQGEKGDSGVQLLPDGMAVSAPASAYPVGVTIGKAAIADGWPTGGTLFTVKYIDNRIYQQLYPKSTEPFFYMRHNYGGTGWGEFYTSQGSKGDQGEPGEAGPPLTVCGIISSPAQLPASGCPGDAYVIQGNWWVWGHSGWVDAGSFRGPPGTPGAQGPAGPQGPPGDAGQVDLAGYAKLSSPVFINNPTAPTPPPGDNSKSICTTEYAQRLVSSSLSSNGWSKLPGGLIFSWGRYDGTADSGGYITFSFSTPFVKCLSATLTPMTMNSFLVLYTILGNPMALLYKYNAGALAPAPNESCSFQYFAVGY